MKKFDWAVVALGGIILGFSLGHPDSTTRPALASSPPPTGTPIPVVTASPLPTSSAAATALPWAYVPANGSIQSARALSQCGFVAGAPVPVGMALVTGTTYRIVALCPNGALLTATVTF